MASNFPNSADVFKPIPTPTTTPTNLSDSFDDTLSTRLQQHSDALAAIENWLLNNASLGEPTGVVKQFAGVNPPTNYLFCNGQAVSRVTFFGLFSVIGNLYGNGDGSTTFNVPNLCGCTVIGAGQRSGLTNRSLSSFGGEENHLLSGGELAAHTHVTPATNHAHTGTHGHFHTVQAFSQTIQAVNTVGGATFFVPAVVATSDANDPNLSIDATAIPALTSSSFGSNFVHNNMQPFVVLNYIIRI